MIADIHTHILYGMDDGADDIRESLKLIRLEAENGVDTVVLTPHFDSYNDSLDIFQKKFRDSYSHVAENISGQNINLLPGSETLYSPALMYYHSLTPLCIYGTRYILTEFYENMNFDKIFFAELEKIMSKFDVIPIIAHAERYSYVRRHMKTLAKLKKTGCLIQVNANYIINNIDRRFVKKLFKYRYVDVIASDCHDCIKRPPNLKDAIELINEKYERYYDKVISKHMELFCKTGQNDYMDAGEMVR